ncbi:MAG TPA: alpha/beta hydrolase-fold protein [Candidatus Acidoferrales bacterium]|nr:alpha/beta hydrolase-fold protein [Candidatus Acidoferrales bacterium]
MTKFPVVIWLCFLCSCIGPPATAQQSAEQAAIRSPRVVMLGKQLKAGEAGALDNFWREVRQAGTPLVEPISGDDRHVLVTFLWRGGPETKNVGLVSDLPGTAAEEPGKSLLENLPGTNVWFRTYKLRNDGRFTYYLSPNDSLLPLAQRKGRYWDTWQADPLNPHHFVQHEDRDYVRSLVELPGATPIPWIEAKSNVPKGRTEEFDLSSKILGEERSFWIYTPPRYTTEGRVYDLLVLFDGENYARTVPTATIIENLLAAGRIRPPIVLMVKQKDRNVELACNERFTKFVVQELIPWVRARYHVTSDPAETTIGGQSFGGLAATFAGLRHPTVFGNVLTITADFTWGPHKANAADLEDLEYEWIIQQFAASPRLSLRFVITAGLFDWGRRYDSPAVVTRGESPHA